MEGINELEKLVDSLDEEQIRVLKEYIRRKLHEGEPTALYEGEPTARLEILYKFPSLNEYTNACRRNAYAGASMKKKVQRDIGYFVNKLPKFEKPITIEFTWIEGDNRRDLDNVAFSKKFILDALVECGKLVDDNRKIVTAFRDKFKFEKGIWKVILEIREVAK